MRFLKTSQCGARNFSLCGLLLALSITAGCGGKPAAAPVAAKPKAAAPKTNSVVEETNVSAKYVSDFEENLLAPKGRDPFFPASSRRNPVPVAVAPTHVDPVLELTAVIRLGKRGQAVINHSSLEVGEQLSIRTPPENRLMVVRCLDIGDDYADIQVQGEAGPRRLVMKKRKGIESK